MQVIVNNIPTSYTKQGKGPVMLFLHGWGDSGTTFVLLNTRLKTQFTCVTLDLPGFGGTPPPKDVWSVEDYANFVASFIQKLGLRPTSLIGHSNGGTISMYLLSHNLLSVNKLVLLSSAGIRNEANLRKQAYKATAKVGKQISRLLPKAAQAKLKRKLYESAGSDILISPQLEETFKKVVSYDIQKDAITIKTPTLLIYASDDTATPARYGVLLQKCLHGSQLEVFHDGGHFIHQTQTTKVADLIEKFVK